VPKKWLKPPSLWLQERTITFYSTIDATKVASYSDKDMRYETKPSGAISVWLGSKSKKVESNLGYIIEDK
jgi:hypothetical protein